MQDRQTETRLNKIVVKEAFTKAKEEFKKGVKWGEMDFSKIEHIFDRVSNIDNDIQRTEAFARFENILDKWAEFIVLHTGKDGTYLEKASKISKNDNIKSKRQFERDSYDSQRLVNTYPFAAFRYVDDDDNEYYTFEEDGKASYSIEEKANFQIALNDVIADFTEEERKVFMIVQVVLGNINTLTELDIRPAE